MRSLIFVASLIAASASTASASFLESLVGDFPGTPVGTLIDISVDFVPGCYKIADAELIHDLGGSDVDYIRFQLPILSANTIIDVDALVTDPIEGDSVMEAGVNVAAPANGSLGFFNDDDLENADDMKCGRQGDPNDSVINLGALAAGSIIDVGVTGKGDNTFTGTHNRKFQYQIWLYTVPEPSSLALLAFGALFVARRKRAA